MTKRSPVNRLKGLFRISPKEAEALLGHLRSAWRHEELIPQPEGYILIPLKRIKPPTNAIREELGDLEELKESIDRSELFEPISVAPLDKEWRKFEVVTGLRRYHAYLKLGLDRIPAHIRRPADGEQLAISALEENVHRKNLTPYETFKAASILRRRGHSLEGVAKRAGMSVTDVSALLRISTLPGEVRRAFFGREISLGHLKILMRFGRKEMLGWLERVRGEHLSVRALENLVAIEHGESRFPEFLRSGGVEELVGSKIFYRRGRKRVGLRVEASDDEELLKILGKIKKK